MLFETGNISETMVAKIVIVSIMATPETLEKSILTIQTNWIN